MTNFLWVLYSYFTYPRWRYLITGNPEKSKYFKDEFSLAKFFCRLKGHGPVWWYSHGLEPDMHCKDCGDDLG